MQLSGDIIKDSSSNAYLNGGIELAPTVVEYNKYPLNAVIPVDVEAIYFDVSALTAQSGVVTAPVVLSGYRFAAGADASKFAFEESANAEITSFVPEAGDDKKGVLTISLSDADNKASASELLNGKQLTVKADAIGGIDDVTVVADFAAATFYPVFDYVEISEGNYIITLYLYSENGTFAQPVAKEAVSFGEDFAAATVTSFTRQSDTVVELVLSLPANGVTDIDDMNLTGEVTLAAGTLVNRWNDASEAFSYTREYNSESMGKIFTEIEVGQIKQIVGGFGNTTFGTIADGLSGAAAIGSGVITVLEVLGVIESEKAKPMFSVMTYVCLTILYVFRLGINIRVSLI